jgi:hypothetical protein
MYTCQKTVFWQFDRDERTVGLVFIIYRLLLVYIRIGLAWWICGNTVKLVRGRRRLTCVRPTNERKRVRGSQLPVTRTITMVEVLQYFFLDICVHILNLVCDCIIGYEEITDIGTLSFRWIGSLYTLSKFSSNTKSGVIRWNFEHRLI